MRQSRRVVSVGGSGCGCARCDQTGRGQRYHTYVRWILFVCTAALASAQGTEPKPKAEDYEVHVAAGAMTLGAEYMVRSFTNGRQTFLIDDYLVVEVALYPPKGTAVSAHGSDFSLRVNGKRPIVSAPAAMAAASLQRVQWKQGARAEATAGVGDVNVGLGRPTQRYPGGEPVPKTRRPPHAPDDPPGGIEREAPVKADELVIQTALPEGEFKGPVSGFVYFPFSGKTSSVKTVELLFRDKTLRLK